MEYFSIDYYQISLMIKTYNQQLVENLLASANDEIRLLFILQIVSTVCCAAFIGWQVLEKFKMFSLFFTLFWVGVEGVAMSGVNTLRKQKFIGKSIVSFQVKRGVIQLIEKYTKLRYIKFIGLLCNFLGIMGAVKAMRHAGAVEWSALICLACLGLCVQWLRVINRLLDCLKKSMEIYDNFQMVIQGESEQQNMREMNRYS